MPLGLGDCFENLLDDFGVQRYVAVERNDNPAVSVLIDAMTTL